MYVRPTIVRRGIGRRLLGVLENAIASPELDAIALHATFNSVGFYEAQGYTNCGTSLNRLPTGVELPCIAMSKRIRTDEKDR